MAIVFVLGLLLRLLLVPIITAENTAELHPTMSTEQAVTRDSNLTTGNQQAADVTVSYTLWVGTNVTEVYSLTLTVPRKSNFYHVMQVAAEQDPHFEFVATEFAIGHYITTLAGYKEQPSLSYFWMLYVLPALPNSANPPGNQLLSPVGVDGLIVEDGGNYLFWFKKV